LRGPGRSFGERPNSARRKAQSGARLIQRNAKPARGPRGVAPTHQWHGNSWPESRARLACRLPNRPAAAWKRQGFFRRRMPNPERKRRYP